MPFDDTYLLSLLDELEFKTHTIEHAPLRTVEEAKELRGEISGGHVKNLFLKDKKGRHLLVVALENTKIDLKGLAKLMETPKLSFASQEELYEYLGIRPGAVSPFAIVNDIDCNVTVVLDALLEKEECLNFHPLRNDRTTNISTNDFLKFLDVQKHKPIIVNFEAMVVEEGQIICN